MAEAITYDTAPLGLSTTADHTLLSDSRCTCLPACTGRAQLRETHASCLLLRRAGEKARRQHEAADRLSVQGCTLCIWTLRPKAGPERSSQSSAESFTEKARKGNVSVCASCFSGGSQQHVPKGRQGQELGSGSPKPQGNTCAPPQTGPCPYHMSFLPPSNSRTKQPQKTPH